MTFIDATTRGPVVVKEYNDEGDHTAVLLCFGSDGPTIKVAPEQAQSLHSALLRMYDCVQS